ncbi:hypothetical protein FRC04_002063 [Tulasnella sp. 424]|nr:hypothetical protein FRC04_002063 [Tulasnella sp. 424]
MALQQHTPLLSPTQLTPLRHRTDPNLRLHGAAAKGDIGSVQYALTHGQPANSVLDGILPLHAACSGGSELVVKLLIDFGADVNAPRLPRRYSDKKSEGGTIIGSSGSTPLHFAAANGHAAIIKILLQRGADPTRTDKYGTKPETLATNFDHDECAQILREWEAAHPPQEPGSSAGGPTTAPLADGPPSPSKSRKLAVKRSLENLLTRKGHGMTPAQTTPSSNAALSPFASFGQGGVDSGTASPFGGFSTPASSSSEAFATLPASGARRPSLPHIFEGSRPSALPVSPHKKGSHRPRSAGQGAEEHNNTGNSSTLSGQKRLASKISLLNIFKKDTSSSSNNPPPLGAPVNASSPNLLEFLAQPLEPGIRTRARNSIDEPRITGNPGPSRGSLDRGDRDRHSPPTTAPPQRTLFFNPASVFSPEDQEDLPPLPSVLLPRTSRSNSQTRTGYPDYRTRTDSNVTMTSTGSSFEAQQNPASYAIQNSWARAKRDRSASEGAGALGKRSPLMNEWGRDEDGNVVEKELPGVIADEDDDEDSAGSVTAAVLGMSTSPEQIRPMDRERKASKPPQLPNGPRRPSLTNGGAGGSSSSFSPAEHKRTNSTQSTKNLRFDLPAGDGQGQRSVSTSAQAPGRSQASPVATSPTSPLAPKGTKKSLRTSASAGSLPKTKPSSSSSSVDRPYSAGGERAGKSGRLGTAEQRRPSAQDDSFDDEDHIAAEEAEGGDSFGELVPRIPSARSGSMSSGYSGRQPVQSLASPATPASGVSTLYSPTSASTISAGGRPWAYPESANPSQTSLPTSAGAPGSKPYSSLAVKGGPTGADGDSRLRGASVSSSKSTDTSASSANMATASSSNGASDSSSPRGQGPGWSTSTSTASAGTTGKTGTIRGPKLGPITTTAAVYRSPYEIDDYESSSSEKEKYTKDTTPLPVLLRTVNSHAQAHALVEKAEKQILDLADLPPDSAGLSDEALSAQLAAFGETLALERRFARGEAQKSVWMSRKGYADDSDEEEVTPDDEKNRSPRREVFGPPMQRKGSGGTMPAMSPLLHRAGSLEFNKNIKQATVRSRPAKSRTPVKSHTTPLSPTVPIRTTPSNVGPPPTDIKPARRSEDLQLTMHGIEITKTLPTPTDSPRSNVDMAAAQSSGRHVGVDETADPQDGVVASPPDMQSLPASQRNPDITVSDFQTVPLSRVSTAPSSNDKSMTLPNLSQIHGRTVSSGHPPVLQGPEDYYPPRSESRTGGKQLFGGLRNFVHTLKGK